MLDRTRASVAAARMDRAPLTVRRVDAIAVALPLKSPMKMAGITIAKAENLLVRIESADGSVGWGEAPSAPTMTGDTLGGLVAAVRDHLAPMLVGQDARGWMMLRPALHRALHGNGGAHSAVEMAVLDLAGRASGKRLIDMVGEPPVALVDALKAMAGVHGVSVEGERIALDVDDLSRATPRILDSVAASTVASGRVTT